MTKLEKAVLDAQNALSELRGSLSKGQADAVAALDRMQEQLSKCQPDPEWLQRVDGAIAALKDALAAKS